MLKNKSVKDENFLLYVPIKKHKTYEERKGRIFLVFHHDKLVEKLASKLFKKPRVSDLELDELGSAVWKLIDGRRTVLQITEEMKIRFGERCEPINERLIMFIRYLNRRDWINFDKSKARNEQ